MDGLARATGNLFREMTVGGKAWRLAPPRLRDFAALEAELLARQPDPIQQAAAVAAQVPPEQQKAFWQEAFAATAKQRRVSLGQLEDLPEMTQLAASAFLALRRHHADEIRTLDDAFTWMENALEEHGMEVGATLQAAVQEWQDPTKRAAAAQTPTA